MAKQEEIKNGNKVIIKRNSGLWNLEGLKDEDDKKVYMKTKSNTSVVVHIEDRDKIKLFIETFKKKTGFKISIAEFVKQAIKEKLK